MRVDQFDFHLPTELIAQHPVVPRRDARLLHVAETLRDLTIGDLVEQFDPKDLLVFNDTAVLPTRFSANRDGVSVEITLIEAVGSDSWWAFAKPGKRLRKGDIVELAPDFGAEISEVGEDGRRLLQFELSGKQLIDQIKSKGAMPVPPYIKRPRGGDHKDHQDYQTIFAKRDGSVAAPTASLHVDQRFLTN